jgi:cytochrome P450
MTTKAAIPDHVPAHLVFDFDVYTAPELTRNPHRTVSALLRDKPPVFFSPANGGHWIVAGAPEAVEILRDVERFSSKPEFCSSLRKPWTLPNQADPPEHNDYRRIISPPLAPKAVFDMEAQIRTLVIGMLDEIIPQGRCEFVSQVGKRFPVTIFLQMAGAPLDEMEKLVEITDRAVRHPDLAERNRASSEMGAYVMKLFEERRGSPGVDMVSRIIKGRFGDRALNDEELLGMGILLFLGGLDTVSATLSFIMQFLAEHPAHYRELQDHPDRLGAAVEELLRVHGVASFQRGVTHDTEWNGIRFRKYDRLWFLPQIFGLDARETPDPLTVNFSRDISRHLGFGAGPHRCVGSHLARSEVQIFLEEWLKRVPRFEIENGTPIDTCGGNVWSPLSLPLVWPVEAKRQAA